MQQHAAAMESGAFLLCVFGIFRIVHLVLDNRSCLPRGF